MNFLEDQAKLHQITSVFLYSAKNAVDFYKILGYIEKEKIIHKGSDIEIRMEKKL